MNHVILASLAFVASTAASAAFAKEPCPYSSREAWQRTVPEKYQRRAEYAFVESDPALPNVLLIGDSISMSYTVGVRERLAGIANVYRAPDNCRSTRQTLAELETYLGDIQWDVIHFNWGIHDVTHVDASGKVAPPPLGKRQVQPDEYRDNFRSLIRRLQKTGAKLIWASTTPIGRKTDARGFRRDSDVMAYNAAAAELLKAEKVATNGLYALIKPRAEQLLSDGVHFNAKGVRVLAEAVAIAIRNTLGDDERSSVRWTGGAKSASWNDPGNWDIGVPDKHDVVIFENEGAGQSIRIDGVFEIGRLELRFANKTDRLALTGSGKLVIHGAETGIRNKYSAGFIQTGVLDFGPKLHMEIRNQRFIAGNKDGTVVIRSNRVRAGRRSPSSNRYPSDGEHLKIAITDRGRFELRTPHWEPGMSLDMSAGHTEGAKVFDFALKDGEQGVTFIRLKEHDGDPVEIHGFDDDDFFRFRADPFTSCDEGKEFRINAVKFVGWPDDGKASVERNGDYWHLKPAAAALPDMPRWR